MDALRTVLLCSLPVFCAGCVSPAVTAYENSQVYQPSVYPEGDWEPAGLVYEDAFFQAEDGTHLHGWFLPHPNPRAVILFAHGNAGNLSHRREMLEELRDRQQVSVMIFDYRGYGRSEGKPREAGLLQDARAARQWLSQRTGVPERDIVLMGRSLGGGVAVDLAANDGAAGLILVSTFNSLVDVAEHHVPWLPAEKLMVNRLDSLSKIDGYHGPLLQTHGDRDRVVPYEYALELFGKANSPKQFVMVAGGGHNHPLSDEFHSALDEFFDSLPSQNESSQQNVRNYPL
jgi:fermentation-respiration switch protein FrsA (DUF1100 family)